MLLGVLLRLVATALAAPYPRDHAPHTLSADAPGMLPTGDDASTTASIDLSRPLFSLHGKEDSGSCWVPTMQGCYSGGDGEGAEGCTHATKAWERAGSDVALTRAASTWPTTPQMPPNALAHAKIVLVLREPAARTLAWCAALLVSPAPTAL